jgi:hypothetical protein
LYALIFKDFIDVPETGFLVEAGYRFSRHGLSLDRPTPATDELLPRSTFLFNHGLLNMRICPGIQFFTVEPAPRIPMGNSLTWALLFY